MPPYELIHRLDLIFMYAVGSILALGVILARLSLKVSFTFKKRSDAEMQDEVHHFGGEVSETQKPMPVLIWIVFIGYFFWAAGYVVFKSIVGF